MRLKDVYGLGCIVFVFIILYSIMVYFMLDVLSVIHSPFLEAVLLITAVLIALGFALSLTVLIIETIINNRCWS